MAKKIAKKNHPSSGDVKSAEALISNLLKYIGEDTSREGLMDTPKRVVRSFEKLFSGYKADPKKVMTMFESETYEGMVVVKNIEFYSMCEHHMLPFFGKAHVAYIPKGKIVGLSKLPRIVEIFSRRLQNQERLTSQIAHTLHDLLKPAGVGVVLEAQHFCMMARGVEKQGSLVTTSALLGSFKKNSKTRSEFLRLIEQ